MSEIFDLLTEEDKWKIERYIHWFAPSESNYMDWDRWAGLENILNEWAMQKSINLLKLMDNQLILRRPYTYVTQAEGLSKIIQDHVNDPAYTHFQHWWYTMTHNAENNIQVLNSDGSEKDLRWFSVWSFPGRCFDSYTLACNAYQDEDIIIVFPSGKKMKMFKGMKPMKIFHRFVEEFNGPEDLYDAFRTWHSMQLNQKKMDGELCLSIHPLDFMTMSDNANNWESCMRWTNKYAEQDTHGDFRAGTVECMNSPYILEAYLHNPTHKYKIDDWTWNSKQWRELFIVQDGIISEIKGYCFQDENLTNAVLMWIKELAAKNLGWTYGPEEINVKNEIPTEEIPEVEMNSGNLLYLSFEPTQYMYNDMGTLNIHRGRINQKTLFGKYSYTERKNPVSDQWSYFINIPYGGVATCMCCGDRYDGDQMSSMVLCLRCDHVRLCACCGEVLSDDNSYYVDDVDDYYCESCWCDNCSTDSLTEEAHLTENMTEIQVLLGFDENQEPVFHDDIHLWVYDPANNWDYQNMFNGMPKEIEVNKWYRHTTNYVTLDMVCDGCVSSFLRACDLYPRPKYLDELYNSYADHIFYDVNENPLYKEEEEED